MQCCHSIYAIESNAIESNLHMRSILLRTRSNRFAHTMDDSIVIAIESIVSAIESIANAIESITIAINSIAIAIKSIANPIESIANAIENLPQMQSKISIANAIENLLQMQSICEYDQIDL